MDQLPVDDYVLYADDDRDDKDFLMESFEKFAKDKKLETVSTGDQLLQYLEMHFERKGLPCLIILDQNMPGLPGDRTLELLKADQRFAAIPVVMFSTSDCFDHSLLHKSQTGYEIKPTSYKDWEQIALVLLEHCEKFKEQSENK
ncbi:MAG TPA: response regulator [Flavisolibacter sp.]|jgi:CheY-like chemotaxis protein|nr:response regulator [Flavisolibacter sp.]